MRKYLKLILLFLTAPCSVFAQKDNTYSVQSTSGYVRSGNTQITYSVGQAVVGTQSIGTNLVSQGFIYPYVNNPVDKSLAQYSIGTIPSQTAWESASLGFYFYSIKLGRKASLSIKTHSKPKGELLFDRYLGLFHYVPAKDEIDKFDVTFFAKVNNQIDSQRVSINVKPYVPIEHRTFIDNAQKLPDATGNEYRVVGIDSSLQEKVWHNYAERNVSKVSISGVDLVFEKGHAGCNSRFRFLAEKSLIRYQGGYAPCYVYLVY
jgi:hypothetical protein